MNHQNARRKLGRTAKQRMAMLGSLTVSILLYEKVKTTEAKAKEVRGLVDRLITKAKVGTLHARRQVMAELHNNELVTKKLFEVLAKRYEDTPGGYTSLVRLGNRAGDNAPMMQISLTVSEKESA